MPGFLPVRSQSSAPYNDGADEFFVPSTDNTPIAIGDPVVKSGAAGGSGYSTIRRAAPGEAVFGIVRGFRPTPSIVANGYRLAGTAAWPIVEHNPDMLFEVTEDGDGGFIPDTNASRNIDFVVGNPSGTQSTAMLDSSTAAVTATLPFRIVGRSMRVNNNIGTLQTIWQVTLNKTSDASGTVGY